MDRMHRYNSFMKVVSFTSKQITLLCYFNLKHVLSIKNIFKFTKRTANTVNLAKITTVRLTYNLLSGICRESNIRFISYNIYRKHFYQIDTKWTRLSCLLGTVGISHFYPQTHINLLWQNISTVPHSITIKKQQHALLSNKERKEMYFT